ncbi:Purine nucleoside phosphorylase [hydrothermal vent metagenome]|uniref:purine-nucleoside phosphorylase n=1 Tax=hydrothermal vent metagenome TaxID=652676 RepID=A0A3B0VDX9_9ZZZZ
MANNHRAKKMECTKYIQSIATNFSPKVAMILGSGLGDFADSIKKIAEIPYTELDGFPISGVGGHAGKLILGTVAGVQVIAMQGRVHYYENAQVAAMKVPIHCFKQLGCELIILTNAAGSLDVKTGPGSIMLISDYINFTGVSPLFSETGNARFVNMVNAYDQDSRNQVLRIAKDNDMQLNQGVYAWMSGPQFETPAEINALRTLGVNAAGMSTVPETIIARQQQMKVLALSVITNYAAGMDDKELSHAQTIKYANIASPQFTTILTEFIRTY